MDKNTKPVRWLTVTAMFMALNIIASMSIFSIPVPGGHLYANDVIICTAALLFDPLAAFIVGGVGAFVGDLLFYPTPMFVSLVTHGLQAVVISLCARKLFTGKKYAGPFVGLILGAVVMVLGYTIGRAYIYSTPVQAVTKLPFQILQAALGVIAAPILTYACGLKKFFDRFIRQD